MPFVTATMPTLLMALNTIQKAAIARSLRSGFMYCAEGVYITSGNLVIASAFHLSRGWQVVIDPVTRKEHATSRATAVGFASVRRQSSTLMVALLRFDMDVSKLKPKLDTGLQSFHNFTGCLRRSPFLGFLDSGSNSRAARPLDRLYALSCFPSKLPLARDSWDR